MLGHMFLSQLDLTRFKLPPQFDLARWMIRPRSDLTLRFHEFYHCGPDSAETLEFIGYLIDRDPPDGRTDDNYHILYQDIRGGGLYYCYGYEEERGDWDAHVAVFCDRWACGEDLEKLRVTLRDAYGPDVEIPDFLEPPPPEVEEMHRETGYDS
jgi:hypothetical protein